MKQISIVLFSLIIVSLVWISGCVKLSDTGCESDSDCPKDNICYNSKYCMITPSGIECGPQEGDLKCHKTCETDSDCSALETCATADLRIGDTISSAKICFLKEDIPTASERKGNLKEAASSHLKNIKCDANSHCPEGLDCISTPETGLTCADKEFANNPCKYYDCPIKSSCAILESYPAKVHCAPTIHLPGGEQTVEHPAYT